MKKEKEAAKESAAKPHAPLKPKKPDAKGAPNNQDPEAQYEDKDES